MTRMLSSIRCCAEAFGLEILRNHSFNNVVGDGNQCCGHVEPQRLGNFEIDEVLEASWLF
jgi:hypothetical protein